MYNQGHGVYNETARSFYNVNPVYNPESNGRAAFQVPTPNQHVPIYNPALSRSNMLAQADMHRMRLETGKIVNYATNSLDAESYSLLESQASAKGYSNLMKGASTVGGVASFLGGLAMANPIGATLMAGGAAVGYFADRYDRYYDAYSKRMGDINRVRNMYSGVGGNIVNPATGKMNITTAGQIASGFTGMANTSGFSEQDMYSIHSMASQSGMMRGHTGSVSNILSRVSTLAKVTKSIMDMGAGIDQHQALEMQRLSEQMGVDLDKFKGLEISRKIVSAARLTGKNIQATNAMLKAAGESSAAAGIGAQHGMESALYISRTAAPQFGYLSARQQARVGGSSDAYMQNLVNAQTKFAASQAQTLAMGSYYVDPTTGQLKIDSSELSAMVEGGYGARESHKRGMQIVNTRNRRMLRRAGINQGFVTNVLQENIDRLGKEAVNSLDKDTMMGMMLQNLVQTAATNGMSMQQAGQALGYTKEEVAAAIAFGENYGKGSARTREEERLQYRQELEGRVGATGFVAQGQIVNAQREDELAEEGRRDANIAAARADRAAAESRGIYGRRNTRTYSDEEIEAITLGGNFRPTGRTLRSVGMTTSSDYTFGVYSGEREKDRSYGAVNEFFGRGKGGFFRNDVADSAMAKEVLQGLYADDFYGKGTEVIGENALGVNNMVMGSIINGEAFGSDDLVNSEVRGQSGRKVLRRAVEEVLGKDSSVSFEDLLARASNQEAAKALLRDDLTGKEASRALAALQMGETAAFGDIYKTIRTAEGRANVTKGFDQDLLSRTANLFVAELDKNASTTEFGSEDRNDTDQMFQTSKQKIIGFLMKTGMTREKAEQMLPAVLARAEEVEGPARNAAAFNARLALTGSTAAGFMGKDIQELSDMQFAKGGRRDFSAYGAYLISFGTATSIEYDSRYNVTMSDIALGRNEGTVLEMEDAAQSLAGVSNALHKAGEANPVRFIAQLSRAWLKFWNSPAAGKTKSRRKEGRDFDKGFKDFLRRDGAKFKTKFDKLTRSQKDALRLHLKQQGANTDLGRYVEAEGEEALDKYERMVEGFLGAGHELLDERGMEQLLKGSDLASAMFGDTGEKGIQKAKELFEMLRAEGSGERAEAAYVSGTGADRTVDIEKIITDRFGGREALGDQYDTVRAMVVDAFGGGDFSKENMRKFARDIVRNIDASKIKPPGASGKGTATDSIVEAVTQMQQLQKATALILAGLAKGEDADLNQAAKLLDAIKSKVIK